MTRSSLIVKVLPSIVLALLASPSLAGLPEDMQDFFNNTGFASNITGANAVHSQEGGYLSAGTGVIRTPVKQLQLMHVQLPNAKAGCGGIDLFTGGFGFISSEQLTQFGQAIMQNAVPFAVDLALQTWAPQLSSKLDTLKDWAQKINNFNMSSCEAAQLAVGGIAGWFDKKESKDFLCKTYSTHSNEISSWLEAKQDCKNPATAAQANEKAKTTPVLKDMVKQNRNVVWYFLMKNAFLNTNLTIAEYLMSMTGTLVNTAKDEEVKFKRYEPLIIDGKTAGFDLMLKGEMFDKKPQSVHIYACDDQAQEKCLAPEIKAFTFDKNSALVPKVATSLQDIGHKLISNDSLTPEQQNLVNAVNFPVLRLITNEIMAGFIPEYHQYGDIIARIILGDYLNQIITQARVALAQNDTGKDKDITWLLSNLDKAQRFIVNKIHTTAYDTLKQKSELVMRSLEIEKVVVGEMSAETEANYYFGHTG